MEAALAAALGAPRGANPLVGAAILGEDGALLHVGHHRGAGTPHAEVDVMRQARAAGTDLSRVTLLVTLEPCRHQGRTGPCAQAIVEAGIPRVIHAVVDPTETAHGGAAYLRDHGVSVRSGLLEDRAVELNHRWIRAQQQRRPFVTVKTAQSLDGRIAAADGSSQWITGATAREHAHGIRARVDAILAGTQTVLDDDPRLTVRGQHGGEHAPAPLRVVMGLREIPRTARIRGRDGRFRHLRTRDPRAALEALWDEGVRHVLVEGGAGVLGAFLAADLADELVIYQAPMVLGAGRPAYPDLGVTTLGEAFRFGPDASDGGPVHQVGADLLWHLQPTSTLRSTPQTTTASSTTPQVEQIKE